MGDPQKVPSSLSSPPHWSPFSKASKSDVSESNSGKTESRSGVSDWSECSSDWENLLQQKQEAYPLAIPPPPMSPHRNASESDESESDSGETESRAGISNRDIVVTSSKKVNKSDESESSSRETESRVDFPWLNDDEVRRMKDETKFPWLDCYNPDDSKQQFKNLPVLYDVSDIVYPSLKRGEIIERFLQWRFFRKKKSFKPPTVISLATQWRDFSQNTQDRIQKIPTLRKEFYLTDYGLKFRIHELCIEERIACAVIPGHHCPCCNPKSPRFDHRFVSHPEYCKLCEELRTSIVRMKELLIDKKDKGIGESDKSSKPEKSRPWLIDKQGNHQYCNDRIEELDNRVHTLNNTVSDLKQKISFQENLNHDIIKFMNKTNKRKFSSSDTEDSDYY